MVKEGIVSDGSSDSRGSTSTPDSSDPPSDETVSLKQRSKVYDRARAQVKRMKFGEKATSKAWNMDTMSPAELAYLGFIATNEVVRTTNPPALLASPVPDGIDISKVGRVLSKDLPVPMHLWDCREESSSSEESSDAASTG